MKLLSSILIFLPLCAHAALYVAATPPSDFVDTEAATNVAFHSGDGYARRFDLTLALNAAASNGVVVAFGSDANANGILERTETDLLVGWEGGFWFFRDRRAHGGQEAARADGSRCLDWRLQLDAQRRAKSLSASDADGCVFASDVPATLFNPNWNLMRITTHGCVFSEGVVVSRVSALGYGVTVR